VISLAHYGTLEAEYLRAIGVKAGLFGLVFLGAVACSSGRPAPPVSAESALAGKRMPDFRRRTLEGSELDTKSLRGRVVVVKFFAEYCAPCTRTLPAVQSLSRELENVQFIGVSEDERRATAEELVNRYRLSFPVVHDAGQVLSGRYRVSDLPITFVIDRGGTVRWVGGAEQTEAELREAIEAMP
jgi:peroxiredoxin